MLASTSASHTCGSTPFKRAVWINVYMIAVRSPPRSEPANSHDLRPSAMPRSSRSAALLVKQKHGLCRGNFIIGASRRRLDIHDHGILDIDEVVQPVSELYALVGLGCPGRLGIRRRDHLGWLALITALSFALGSTTLVVILGIAISRRFGF